MKREDVSIEYIQSRILDLADEIFPDPTSLIEISMFSTALNLVSEQIKSDLVEMYGSGSEEDQ